MNRAKSGPTPNSQGWTWPAVGGAGRRKAGSQEGRRKGGRPNMVSTARRRTKGFGWNGWIGKNRQVEGTGKDSKIGRKSRQWSNKEETEARQATTDRTGRYRWALVAEEKKRRESRPANRREPGHVVEARWEGRAEMKRSKRKNRRDWGGQQDWTKVQTVINRQKDERQANNDDRTGQNRWALVAEEQREI